MDVSKKIGMAEPLAPWLLLIMLIFIVVIAIVSYLKVMSVIYVDESKVSHYTLHTMLESTDCTPVTKLPLRDVLVLGIAEGKTKWTDTVDINYRGVQEGQVMVVGPLTLTIPVIIGDCVLQFQDQGFFGTPESFFHFYVEYSACPGGKCFEYWLTCTDRLSSTGCRANLYPLPAPLTTSSEYIALPNGDVARVVLETKG